MATNTAGTSLPAVAPLLRWAGGKRWMVARLRDALEGRELKGYHEPFLGGGAMFFGLDIGAGARLSDLNEELVEVYEIVRDQPEEVSAAIERQRNTAVHYYALRDASPSSASERAARFIFLNHTSYNGIYRVNLKGEYNVPFGNRANIFPPTLEQLLDASKRLRTAKLAAKDFADTAKHVKAGDLVFLDPPYTVSHNNNGFIKYNQKLFSVGDQERLSALLDDIKARGAYYVLTNAAHDFIAELFDKGDTRISMNRRNSIGGYNAARGSTTEYLFTNLKGLDV